MTDSNVNNIKVGYTGFDWQTHKLKLLSIWDTLEHDTWLKTSYSYFDQGWLIKMTKNQSYSLQDVTDVNFETHNIILYTLSMASRLVIEQEGRSFMLHPLVMDATLFDRDATLTHTRNSRDLSNTTTLLIFKIEKNNDAFVERPNMMLETTNLEYTKKIELPEAEYTDHTAWIDNNSKKTILILNDNANYLYNKNVWNLYHHPNFRQVAKRFPKHNILSLRKSDPFDNVFKYGYFGFGNFSQTRQETLDKLDSMIGHTDISVVSWCVSGLNSLDVGVQLDAENICLFDRFMHCMNDTDMYRIAFDLDERHLIQDSVLTYRQNNIHVYEAEGQNNEFNDTQYATLSTGMQKDIDRNRKYYTAEQFAKYNKGAVGNLLEMSLLRKSFVDLRDVITI